MNLKSLIKIALFVLIIPLVVAAIILISDRLVRPQTPTGFNGQRAYQDVQYQVALGPRTPGSEAHGKVITWMSEGLNKSGWQVEIQNGAVVGNNLENVVARRGSGKPWIILGAHYDSRFLADNDPDSNKHTQPVPGANDGASGVAVLMELARSLPQDFPGEVWLVFFDAEDQGRIPGWDWILGSRYFASQLKGNPDAVVVIDMIGDSNLGIYKEKNSNQGITNTIWQYAKDLGFDNAFIPQEKFSMIDDHTPFLEKGLAAIDIIDFEYPYWHTTQDTSDKVSPESLNMVGSTLYKFITGSSN
jgi:glutaminyl-peptide cyclotransferase